MARIAQKHSDVAQVFVVNRTFEGRVIYGLKLGARAVTAIDDGVPTKPAVLLEAGMHAREWIAISTIVFTMHSVCGGPNSRTVAVTVAHRLHRRRRNGRAHTEQVRHSLCARGKPGWISVQPVERWFMPIVSTWLV